LNEKTANFLASLLNLNKGSAKQKIALIAIGLALYFASRIVFQGNIIDFFIGMTVMLLVGKAVYAALIFFDAIIVVIFFSTSIPFIDFILLRDTFGPVGYWGFWFAIAALATLVSTVIAYCWCRYVLLPLLQKRIPNIRDYMPF